jgi:hypothetical protein
MSELIDQLKAEVVAAHTPAEETVNAEVLQRLDAKIAEAQTAHDTAKAEYETLVQAREELAPTQVVPEEPVEPAAPEVPTEEAPQG